jgi:glycosyltransferase involved in cell wall biosynthesis
MKLWFLTRSLFPYQKTGGGQIRTAQVESLKKLDWNVVVVMPNYENNTYVDNDNFLQIPFRQDHRFATLLEIVGIYEDYLDKWVKEAFSYLKNKVNKEDLIFATSGGELGMIKLAVLLKKELGCKIVANFHDPLVYSLVHGHKLQYRFHVSREKVEYRYIKEVDQIITSSISYKEALLNKYPFLEKKIEHIYFGYIKKYKNDQKSTLKRKKIHIAYAGEMSETQKPEILLELLKYYKNIKLFYIGNFGSYSPLKEVEDERVEMIDYMPHDKFLSFMRDFIDVGFVSLAEEYFGACIPSKIYEYINLELPILGALPSGDAMDIINKNCYGIAVNFNDRDALVDAFKKMKKREVIKNYKANIHKQKDVWYFENQFKKVDRLLKSLIDE